MLCRVATGPSFGPTRVVPTKKRPDVGTWTFRDSIGMGASAMDKANTWACRYCNKDVTIRTLYSGRSLVVINLLPGMARER